MIDKIMALTSVFLIMLICASAEDEVFCDSLPMQITEWTYNFTVPKFDPSVGTLTGVDIGIILNLTQRFKVANNGGSNVQIDSSTNSSLLLAVPDNSLLKANASLALKKELEPFEGTTEFSGSSEVNQNDSSSGVVTYPYFNTSDFVAVALGETVQLKGMTNTKPRVSISGGTSTEVQTLADARVCVSYHYDPKSSTSGGRQ